MTRGDEARSLLLAGELERAVAMCDSVVLDPEASDSDVADALFVDGRRWVCDDVRRTWRPALTGERPRPGFRHSLDRAFASR
jgi:hypothetical protein